MTSFQWVTFGLLISLSSTLLVAKPQEPKVEWHTSTYTMISVEQKPAKNDPRKLKTLKLFGLRIDGREVVPPVHETLSVLKSPLWTFGHYSPEKGVVYIGLMDISTGKIIFPAIYRSLTLTLEGLVRFQIGDQANPPMGLMDMSGKVLLPPHYEMIDNFIDDLMPVLDSSSGWWVDRNFQPVLKEKQYQRAHRFQGGRATVASVFRDKEVNFRYIDRQGNDLGPAPDPLAPIPYYQPPPTDETCKACTGTGGRFEQTQHITGVYADVGGHANTVKSGQWTSSKRVGDCPVCEGRGRVKILKK